MICYMWLLRYTPPEAEKLSCADPEGGPGVRTPPPLKNHKNIGFLSNSDPDPLKNYKATEPAFNVGPSSARQRNAILMAFCWRADNSPLIVVHVFGSSPTHQLKKQKQKNVLVGPPLTKISGSAHDFNQNFVILFKRCPRFGPPAPNQGQGP